MPSEQSFCEVCIRKQARQSSVSRVLVSPEKKPCRVEKIQILVLQWCSMCGFPFFSVSVLKRKTVFKSVMRVQPKFLKELRRMDAFLISTFA